MSILNIYPDNLSYSFSYSFFLFGQNIHTAFLFVPLILCPSQRVFMAPLTALFLLLRLLIVVCSVLHFFLSVCFVLHCSSSLLLCLLPVLHLFSRCSVLLCSSFLLPHFDSTLFFISCKNASRCGPLSPHRTATPLYCIR